MLHSAEANTFPSFPSGPAELIAWHPHRAVLATCDGVIRLEDMPSLSRWRATLDKPWEDCFSGCDWSANGRYLVAAQVISRNTDWPRVELIRIDVKSGATKVLAGTHFRWFNWGPDCSPTGDEVVFLSDTKEDWLDFRPSRLAVMPIFGGKPRVLLEAAGGPVGWSPDGAHLFAERVADDRQGTVFDAIWETVVVTVATGEVKPVSNKVWEGGGVLWSGPQGWLRDGRLLYLGTGPDQTSSLPRGLFAVDWKAGESELLLQRTEWEVQSARVSPDGRFIACIWEDWEEDREGSYLTVYDLKRGRNRRLLFVPWGPDGYYHLEGAAEWSPDGSQIAYWQVDTDRRELWLVQADGTNNRKIWPPIASSSSKLLEKEPAQIEPRGPKHVPPPSFIAAAAAGLLGIIVASLIWRRHRQRL